MQHNDTNTSLASLKERVAQFVHERDWQQFHDPKSLSMAIALEAAELMEHFVWAGNREQAYTQVEEKREAVEQELVDILHVVFCIRKCMLYRSYTSAFKKNGIECAQIPYR